MRFIGWGRGVRGLFPAQRSVNVNLMKCCIFGCSTLRRAKLSIEVVPISPKNSRSTG